MPQALILSAILAETAVSDTGLGISIDTVVQITTGATAFALIAWVLKRVFNYTIPRLAADFKESLAKQQEIFQAELQRQRETFERELTQLRLEMREELKEQRKEFREELQREREFFEHQLMRLNRTLEALEQFMKDQGDRS
jgi:flagellar motility protein MotE (MotC chaperone)